ncbi:MAG: anhydro-N-acetylmuramic acid kinase, partial [Sphaerochaeta sp.]|nr:anhydro-N-acetylmuramic acid kinase [Sphaerochaeta sp.]
DSVFAFATGPGNMIIDRIVSIGTNHSMQYDDGGAIASRGNVSQVLLSSLMEDPYFSMKPPKSTGREVYGDAFAQSFWKKGLALGLSFEDLVATSTAFTAHSIAQSYKDFVLPVTPLHTVIVSGGGARNKTLLSMLSELLPNEIEVMISDDFGVPDQAREAMAFALMGHESLMGRPGNIPSVTGARKSVVLGVVTMQHI